MIAWIHSGWFLAGTIVGYWLSNVLGILMMQFGAMEVFLTEEKRNIKRDLLIGVGGSTLYTVVIALLVYFRILQVPDFIANLQL